MGPGLMYAFYAALKTYGQEFSKYKLFTYG